MRRIAVELPIVAVAVVLIAGMVLAAGGAIEPPPEPVLLPIGPAGTLARSTAGCVEAVVTALSTAAVVGHTRLCKVGCDLHVTLRADGLAPGVAYSVWLGYAHDLEPRQEPEYGQVDLPSGHSAGLMQRVVSSVSPTSQMIELDADIRDAQPSRGAQLSLVLLRPGEPVGRYAQATFIVP